MKILLLLGSLPLTYSRHKDIIHMVRKEREKSQKISENYHVFLCDKDDESHSGDIYMTRI